MKTLIWIILIFSICSIGIESCKKPHTSCNVSGGGLGGNITLAVTGEHHGLLVDSCTIYIAYGTLNPPANGVYDDSAPCVLVDTTPIATFHGLKPGQYYIFGQGYHPEYPPPNVRGGLPTTICSEDSIYIVIPVYSYTP